MNGLTEAFAGEADVLQLDAAVPENGALQQRYGVRGHPTFVVLDGSGEVTARFIGPQEAEVLRAALAGVAQE